MSASVEQFLHDLVERMEPALAKAHAEELAALLDRAVRARLSNENPPPAGRWQDAVIEDIIPARASVLDLGCGEGQLLARLIRDKHVRGQGIELNSDGVFKCVERCVPVFQTDLDAGLKGFAEGSFDYVILEETLQTLRKPAEVLSEVLRVGRTGIVSFPNFGYWQVRLDLAVGGRMPVTSTLPYRWHDTPNIHLLTLSDFEDWAGQYRVKIAAGHALAEGKVRALQDGDALYAEEVLLVIEKQ